MVTYAPYAGLALCGVRVEPDMVVAAAALVMILAFFWRRGFDARWTVDDE